MTTFIFVRHGQSQTNLDYQFAGQADTLLTQQGVLQAKLLSEWISSNYTVDKIYSSDLSRAYNTALISSEKIGVPVYKRC